MANQHFKEIIMLLWMGSSSELKAIIQVKVFSVIESAAGIAVDTLLGYQDVTGICYELMWQNSSTLRKIHIFQ